MKGIIFYYSGSGNTKLALEYIAKNIKNVKFDFSSMVRAEEIPDLKSYDIVGFASFTDFWAPSQLVYDFMEKIPQQNKKLAFVFATYGFILGRNLKTLAKLARSKGFNVAIGEYMKSPESHVPSVVNGITDENAPNNKEMIKLKKFISDFNEIIESHSNGKEVKNRRIKNKFLFNLFPIVSRTMSRRDMGDKFVDEELCTECGTCEKGCPYYAITLDPKPKFDMTKCYGCWYCYNHCPQKAIYTKKFRGVGHYPRPNAQFKEKMKS